MQTNVEAVVGALSRALLFGSGLVWVAVVRRLVAGKPVVKFERRYRQPWSGLDVAVLAVAVLFFELAASKLATAAAGESYGDALPLYLAARSVGQVAWLAFALVYLVAKSGAYLDDLGFDAARLAGDMRLGGLTFLAALVPVYAVQWFFVFVLDMPSKHPLVELMEKGPGFEVMVLVTFVAVVMAPLWEEFVFRVLLQGWLENLLGRIREPHAPAGEENPGLAPIVIASAIFGALHMAHGPDPVALFVFALFLGYAYRQTHRVVPSIVAHFCLNAWTMVSLWVKVYGGAA